MRPVSPVLPSASKEVKEVIFAKDQPEYRPLPAVIVKTPNGTIIVITSYKLSFLDRLKVLIGGRLWFSQLTFGDPLQPQMPSADEPEIILVE